MNGEIINLTSKYGETKFCEDILWVAGRDLQR